MGEHVGFDVSKEATAFCVMDEEGVILARGKVSTDPDALFEVLREHCLCPERIVLETGTLSFWLARGGGLSGAHDAALSVRRDGLLGAHIQAR